MNHLGTVTEVTGTNLKVRIKNLGGPDQSLVCLAGVSASVGDQVLVAEYNGRPSDLVVVANLTSPAGGGGSSSPHDDSLWLEGNYPLTDLTPAVGGGLTQYNGFLLADTINADNRITGPSFDYDLSTGDITLHTAGYYTFAATFSVGAAAKSSEAVLSMVAGPPFTLYAGTPQVSGDGFALLASISSPPAYFTAGTLLSTGITWGFLFTTPTADAGILGGDVDIEIWIAHLVL